MSQMYAHIELKERDERPLDPHAGMVLRHHSGHVYTVLSLNNLGVEAPGIHRKTPVNVTILGANGYTWTRTLEDIRDREKFTVLFDGTNLARLGEYLPPGAYEGQEESA